MLPETILAWCAEARAVLDSVHPLAIWAVLSALSCVVYLPRWLAPVLWSRLPPGHRLDTIPAAIFGAAWATVTTGDGDPAMAVKGAVAAILIPLLVHYRESFIGKAQT